MRKIVLSAVFALGMGLAASTGTSAAPLSNGLGAAVPNASMIQNVALVCRNVTVCHRNHHGYRVCHVERRCRHVY